MYFRILCQILHQSPFIALGKSWNYCSNNLGMPNDPKGSILAIQTKRAISVWIDHDSNSCRSMPLSSMSFLICCQNAFFSNAGSPGTSSHEPPCLSRKCETSGVGLTRQDHSLEVIDSLGSGFGVGFCHGQSGSVLNRWAISSRWVIDNTIPANNGNTSASASGYRR